MLPTRKLFTGDETYSLCPLEKRGRPSFTRLSRLYQAFGEHSPQEAIALKTAMVLPALMLQRPHSSAGTTDHTYCLERRLPLCRAGRIDELIREGHTMQGHLAKLKSRSGLTIFAWILFYCEGCTCSKISSCSGPDRSCSCSFGSLM